MSAAADISWVSNAGAVVRGKLPAAEFHKAFHELNQLEENREERFKAWIVGPEWTEFHD
jgi:hypothetical protein